MKLLIDIGNTNTVLALVEKSVIVKSYFLRTTRKNVQIRSLRRLLEKYVTKINTVVIVSVVPVFLDLIKKKLKTMFPDIRVFVTGRDIKVPIKIRCRYPEQIGQDRLVAGYAARQLFGYPIIVIDFGTAVTFDYINKRGEYAGGLIFPGLRLGLTALNENTALLPYIYLRPVKGLIGKDTDDSMNKGILYGYSALCDGIVERFREKYGPAIRVVATGGDAPLVCRYSTHVSTISKDLLIKGLDLFT